MPEIDQKYVKNTYGLLKNAYGDKIKISEEDFYKKIEEDSSGTYRRNVFGMLKNVYGDKMSVDGESFSKKLSPTGVDPLNQENEYREKSIAIENELGSVKTQLDLIKRGEKASAPPEEWIKEKKQDKKWWEKEYNVLTDDDITKLYWQERHDLLNQEKQKATTDSFILEKAQNLTQKQKEEIINGQSKELLAKGYDIETIQYLKREDHFNKRKENVLQSIKQNPSDATLNLSLFNYAQQKDDDSYNSDLANAIRNSEFNKIRDYDDRVKFIQKQSDDYVAKHKGEKSDELLRKDFYSGISKYVLFDEDKSPSMFAMQNMARINELGIDNEIKVLQEKKKKIYEKGLAAGKSMTNYKFSKRRLEQI